MAYRDRDQKLNIFEKIAAFSDDRFKSSKKNVNVQTKASILSSTNSQAAEPAENTVAIDNGAVQTEIQADSNALDQQATVAEGTYYYDNSEYNYDTVVDNSTTPLAENNASGSTADMKSKFMDLNIADIKLNPQTARNVIIMSEILSIPVSKRKKP